MSLQDVSNDRQMLDWLRQSGHAHLVDERAHNANASSSSPLTGYPYGQTTSSSNYPPQPTSLSSISPIFSGGGGGGPPPSFPVNSFNQPSSYPPTDIHASANYGATATSSPLPIGSPPYGQHSSPLPSNPSPTHLLAPNRNQQQLDMDIENMKRDPNTRVVQRPPQEDVVYKQRVFVRYLQPPTPPVGGTIIVREKQQPPPPPDPPIVIKRAPPPPPTPPPVTIRERPPPLPPAEGTTVIDKLVPPGPKPPRQLIIEQYAPLPPKPQDVIIERWLPVPPRTRRILYERLPPTNQPATRPIIVQYGPPQVRVKREVVVAPAGTQLPYQQVAGNTDINQMLSQIGGNSALSSTLSPSSLVAYNPYSSIQPNYGTTGQSQPNIVILQNGQPSNLPSSSYGLPLTNVSTPNQLGGLGIYGGGLSTTPAIGQSSGQTMVYNVPDNVPIDGILRQLGIDPYTIQRSSGSPLPTYPHSAVGNVWNAASHANPTYPINPGSAVSHVWNAAAHTTDMNRPPSPAAGRAWDRIENYMHSPNNAVRSAWDHITHPNSLPPQSNYPPPSSSYPPPPYYPPPSSSYPPPSPTNYPPPPPPANYPPPPSNNYPPPPPSNYPPPPPSNYPPPPPNSYPPPPPSSYPPPGGSGGAGSSVLSRLFGGGR